MAQNRIGIVIETTESGSKAASATVTKSLDQIKASSVESSQAVEQAATSTASATKTVGSSLDTATPKASDFATSLGRIRDVALGVYLPQLAAQVVGLGKSVITSAADYEQSLNVFQSVSSATAAQMDLVGKKAKDLGNDITLPGISAKDAALAMVELSKAGLSVNDTLTASKGVLSLAKAGQMEVADAALATARALSEFGLAGDQASMVADLFAGAANASTSSVSDLTLSLSQTGSTAKMAGVSLSDTVTALALLSNAGQDSTKAGTDLNQMFMQLASPTKQASDLMTQLGLDFYDAKGNFIGLAQTGQQLQDRLKGLTQEQQNNAYSIIFGNNASAAAAVLAQKGAEGFGALAAQVTKSGAATQLAAAQNSGFKGALDNLVSTLQTVGITVGTSLLPGLTSIARSISAEVQPAFDKLVDVGQKAGDYLGPKFSALGKIVSADVIPPLNDLWQNVLKPLAPVIGSTLVGGIGLAVDALTKMIDGVHWVVNAIQTGNPVVLTLASAFGVLAGVMAFNAVFDAITLGFTRFTLITIPSAIASMDAFGDSSVAMASKQIASWAKVAAGATKNAAISTASWVKNSAIVVAGAVKDAALTSAAWTKNAVISSASWVVQMAKVTAAQALVALKATPHAVDTGLAWTISAARVSLVWVSTELPKLIAGFVKTSASAVANAAVVGVTWTANAVWTSTVWVNTELPKIIAGFVKTSAAAVVNAAKASATWIVNAAQSSFAWVVTELPKIVSGFVITSAGAVTNAAIASGAWIASAASSSFAWLVNELPRIIAGFVAMSSAAVAQAAVASAAWVSSAAQSSAAVTELKLLVATPIVMPAIAIAAALVAIAQVKQAYDEMKSAIDGAKQAANESLAITDQMEARNAQIQAGPYSLDVKERYQTAVDNAQKIDAQNSNSQSVLNSDFWSALFGISAIPGRALGTTYSTGGQTVVGEHGPEIVNMPAGSSVTPAYRSRSEGSQSGRAGHTINVQSININNGGDYRRMLNDIGFTLELAS